MNRLIQLLIRLERFLRSPRVLSRLRYLGWQWIQVRRTVLLSLLFIVALFGSLAWGWQSMVDRFGTSAPRYGGTYTEALAGRSEIINPLFSPANPVDADIVRLVYSGLLRRDVDGALKPDLAQSYAVSADQSTYTVKMKKDLRWQDDVALTARDVVFTIGLIHDKDYDGPLKSEWKGVTVEQRGDDELTFKLQTPYAFFPVDLSLPILPWHLLKDVPAKNAAFAAFNDAPVGSGPFQLTSRKTVTDAGSGQIQEVSLRRSRFYSGPQPYVGAVTFKIFDTPHHAYHAYERRSVQGVGGIPAEDAVAASHWKGLQRLDRTLPQYSALFYNVAAKNSPVADRKVRLALSELIDRRALIQDSLAGRAFPAYYPLIAGETGYNPSLPRIGFDPAAAAKTLDEAGWVKDPKTGKRAKSGQPLKLALLSGDTPSYRSGAEFVKRVWEKAGATVELKSSGGDDLGSRIKNREYQVLLYGINLGPTGDLYPFWHSSGVGSKGLNLSNYSSSVVDRALEQARLSADPAQVRQKYDRAQRAWLEDVPAHVLYTPIYEIGVDQKVGGVKVGELSVPADRFSGFGSWFIKKASSL